MTTNSIAIVQSALFGGSKGTSFNDLESVFGGSASTTINSDGPIKRIHIAHGGVVEGMTITYNKAGSSSKSGTDKTHGTNPEQNTDTALTKSWIPGPYKTDNLDSNNRKEIIIAISGLYNDTKWGKRIVALSFMTYSAVAGEMHVYGPYGGTKGTAFRVTANGSFVAFGGYAADTNDSVVTALKNKEDGGIYGLTFAEVAYRTV
ncbi:hypothetical protein C8R44DRAFT_886913 [Mycena epipterygia]|nr:hypothetical protein C8R44DRAFT_886913 [Mycena epipterygia]